MMFEAVVTSGRIRHVGKAFSTRLHWHFLCYVVRVRTRLLCVYSIVQVLAQIRPSPARFRHKPDWEASLLAGGCLSYGLFRWPAAVDVYGPFRFVRAVALMQVHETT